MHLLKATRNYSMLTFLWLCINKCTRIFPVSKRTKDGVCKKHVYNAYYLCTTSQILHQLKT